MLAFTTAVTGATVLLFGLAPAFGVSVVSPQDALKEQGRGVAGDRRMTLRHALVVMQVALSLTLVVGAILFARTFTALVDPRGRVRSRPGADRGRQRARGATCRRTSAPGSTSACDRPRRPCRASRAPRPPSRRRWPPAGWNMGVAVPPDSPLGRRERMTWVNAVSPDWFSTFGMRLAAGRDVEPHDATGGPKVALVNRTFARRFLKPGNPVGQEFKPATAFWPARHVRGHRPGRGRGLPFDPRRAWCRSIYVPLAQWDARRRR